jgi:PAS domain S-box-containing protein
MYDRLRLLALSIVLLFILSPVVHASPAAAQTIIAAVPESFPPYYQLNEHGEPEGFAIDVMNALAQRSNLSVEYKLMPGWREVFAAAKAKEVNLIPNIGQSGNRAAFLDFSHSVETFHLSLFVRQDSVSLYKDLSSMKGRKVGVVKTNVASKVMREYPDIQLMEYASFEQMLYATIAGQIEGLIYPEAVGWKMLGLAKQEHELKVVGEPIREIKRAIGVVKGQEALLQRLNAQIDDFVIGAEYQEIYKKWFAEAPPFWSMQRLIWVFSLSFVLLIIGGLLWRQSMLVSMKRRLDQEVQDRTKALMKEVKEHRQAKDALKASEHMLQEVLNTIPVRVFWKDREFRYLGCNRLFARDAGLQSEADIVGKTDFDLPWTEQTEAYREDDAQVMASRQSKLNFEEPQDQSDGARVWLETSKIPLLNAEDEVFGVLGTYQDITSRKETQLQITQARDEAERASEAKSIFLSSMSHELRTPMNAILGFSQLLGMDKTLSDHQRECVENIIKGGGHLLELIDQVLDLSLIEAGKPELYMENVKVADIVADCETLISPIALKKGVSLQVDEVGDYILHADGTRLKQVLLNFLSNAVKYNRPNGYVHLFCELVDPSRLRIVVEDSGQGLDEEQLAKIFQHFERAGAELSGIEGTGIGLVIAKRLIELMGGSVGVSSEPGKGSFFWCEMNLAVADTEIPSVEAIEPAPVAPSPVRHGSILYIEDNEANLQLMQQMIEGHTNYTFTGALDPKTGLGLATIHCPDVILLDINLPGMDGYEVLKRLRTNPSLDKAAVIGVSANAMAADVEKAAKLGFDAYVAKPINMKELLASIDQVVAKKAND